MSITTPVYINEVVPILWLIMSVIHKSKIMQKWRITINKAIADKLKLHDKDYVEFVEATDGTIYFRKFVELPHRLLCSPKKEDGDIQQ
jgi:hypothetical protein